MNRQLFEHHPVLGHRFIPGLRARVDHEAGGYLMRTNASGFRCRHPFEKAPTPGRRRVLLFGDSYTAGDGVSDKHRYGERLEALRPDLEVYNFGLPGSGTDQQYLAWREFARDVACDAVVLAVMVENVRRVAARYRPYTDRDGTPRVFAKPWFELDADGALTLRGVPVRKTPIPEAELPAEERASVDESGRAAWLRRAVNRLGPDVKDVAQRLTRYQPLPEYDEADHPAWRLLSEVLRRWVGEIEAPVLLFPIPLYQYVEETASAEAYRARFRELADETGAAFCDPLPDLQLPPRPERRGFRFREDPHPTPAAHAVLARALARGLAPVLERGAA